ncbi:MAG TPA: hypothetical protein VMB48_03300 [Steroidobacteraceae bacterium]|nr:hypothetical protein [Steroidobacteraceae bacterium]
MSVPRSLTAAAAGSALALLGGCATGLSAVAPRHDVLSGQWQIDMNLSDYPNEAVPASGGGGFGGGGDSGNGGGGGSGGGGGGMGRHMRRRSMTADQGTQAIPAHRFAMPPRLVLAQSATGLAVHITMPDGHTVEHEYRAGDKSVVTTTDGAANRQVGWQHGDFVISTQVGEKGPKSEVRYFVDDDRMLEVVTTISHAGRNDFQYTLVYDRG